MKTEFTIVPDPARATLRVTMRGFFSHAEVAAFVATLEMRIEQLGCAPNRHRMICDIRKMAIQSQDIVEAFTRIVGNPRFRSERLAFVTGSTLARLQARRLTKRPGVSFFSDPVAAEAWLFEDALAA